MDKKTVLVVDEDAASLEQIGLVVTRSGFSVVEASTGPEALEKTRLTQPDLIIIDINCLDSGRGYNRVP